MMVIRPFLLTVAFVLLASLLDVNCQTVRNTQAYANYPLDQLTWVDQQMQSMTPEQRIGQLFMIAAYSNRDNGHRDYITSLVRNYNIGGLIFMQGEPTKQVNLTSYYQAVAKTPLMIAMDAEWGLSMRLKNSPKFPRQLTLGAIQDNTLIYEMGKDIARQCKRMGVHVNFAPVVDVNNNPNNPVINNRSFGENKYNVAQKGIQYMQGMEMNGILACAKHFPGHGDTDSDSHHTLPVIKHDVGRLNDIELYPFQQMISRGIGSIMIAHLAVPALDNTPITATSNLTMPTTLSKKVVTDLLKKQMGYQGLIFTDALNMKGVTNHFSPGLVDVKALLAGNDVLLFSENVGKAIQAIKAAIKNGEITQEEIDERVRKILKAKFRVGLHKPTTLSTNNLIKDLKTPQTDLLIQRLFENAHTLAKNDKRLIPFQQLGQRNFGSLALGVKTLTGFQRMLGKYAPFEHHTLRKNDSQQSYDAKFHALKDNSTVVVSLHAMNKRAKKNFGLTPKAINLIKQLKEVTDVIITVFGSPYSLSNFDQSSTVLVGYEDNATSQSVAAQILFGAIGAKGKLPVTASPSFRYGQGYNTASNLRLKYTLPEEVGINSADLSGIDRIAAEAISTKSTPGCQVLVAKDGKVIFEKSYGYHTYSKRVKVKNDDLYDIASITKVAASMMGIMEMYEEGALGLESKLGDVLPDVRGSNKNDLVIKDILTHQAGLRNWIPFYSETLPGKPHANIYKRTTDDKHSVIVANNMYMANRYVDVIWDKLNQSKLESKAYKYSDLGFYYFKRMLDHYASKRYNLSSADEYLDYRFYKPLGLATMSYNPREKFSTYSIIPTENDKKWRKQIVHGHVHDMGAAMLGGVSGHAGLFSNANDLAILMQMLLNGGNYAGIRYFNPNTIRTFTTKQNTKSRRGLGFDKPEPDLAKRGLTSAGAPESTFGHTGFTGTCAWVDPDNNLVYIFLSNRVYPNMNNWKLVKNKIRSRIQDQIYIAVTNSKRKMAQTY